MDVKGALQGIRVVECSSHIMIPNTGSVLGDFGAEVVKVEDPVRGDAVRGYKKFYGVPVRESRVGSYHFEALNRHKKSVTIDLKKPAGREIFYRLIAKSDVFLTNFQKGIVSKLGMTYQDLSGYNPRLVYVSATGFGDCGPGASDPAFDLVAQARAGAMTVGRAPGTEPFPQGILGDQAGCAATVIGVLLALLARDRLGVGQEVSTSLLGSLVWMQSVLVQTKLFTGMELSPFDQLNPTSPLVNRYRAGDGKWFVLAMGGTSDLYWPGICLAIGMTELEKDPRFNSMDKREHNTELVSIFNRVFAQKTRDEWMKVFRERKLIAQPVLTISETVDDPDVTANGYVVEYDHPALGMVRLVGPPVHLSKTPASVGHAPVHGQHTEEVLRDVCGYSWEDIGRFKDEGTI